MMTRRVFIRTGTISAAGLLLSLQYGCGGSGDGGGATAEIEKFVDALPVPGVLQPEGQLDGATFYRVTMSQFVRKLHRDLPATALWGYNGVYPGPTLEARVDELVRVEWINQLPTSHLFAVDPTLNCGTGAGHCAPDVRTSVHVHGGNQPADSDGFPEDWWIPGTSRIFTYPNRHLPATLWYHDHALGITRLNVYAGLAGFKIIRDAAEEALNLPSGAFEIPIMIQDRSIKGSGSLFYRLIGEVPEIHPNWVPEFFGSSAVVNGMLWPFLEVEPRKYRFRLLNACNARFLTLQFDSGQPFVQIGSDGGLLKSPVMVARLTLAPAERADVIVDFSGREGQKILLANSAPSPFPGGGSHIGLPEIMQFRVKSGAAVDNSTVPLVLSSSVERIPESRAERVIDFTLDEVRDSENESIKFLLDSAPLTTPTGDKDLKRLGSTEIWRIINLTSDTQPIHIHLTDFQILDRRPFDVGHYKATTDLLFTGPAESPDPNEMGWKDTAQCPPGYVTRFIMTWTGSPGTYVWNCSILERQDNEMIRPMLIT